MCIYKVYLRDLLNVTDIRLSPPLYLISKLVKLHDIRLYSVDLSNLEVPNDHSKWTGSLSDITYKKDKMENTHLTYEKLRKLSKLCQNEKNRVKSNDSQFKFIQKIENKLQNMMTYKESLSSIDRVTTTNLDASLGIIFDKQTLDIIIDVIELLERNGDNTSIFDILELKKELEL